uniref:Uncharacterized protein n=1 Tax=Arundo donax TaxID=35708 RepID=A0A0A8YE59_ARUDO
MTSRGRGTRHRSGLL